MRWNRPNLAAPPVHAGMNRLDREREQLEKLIATTDNQSIAEMAKIKLRVVNFVQTTPSAAKLADEPASDPTNDIAPLLPRPLTIADAAHLIDLQRQQPSLERIREYAPHPLPEPPPPPVAGVAFFSATSSRPLSPLTKRHRVITLSILYAGLLAMMVTLASVDVISSPTMGTIMTLLLILELAVIAVALLEHRLRRPLFDQHITVSWQGVERSRRLYRWCEVEAISLAIGEESCNCEIQLHDGKVMLATLTCFEPSFDQWLIRLREHLADHAPATIALEKRSMPCPTLSRHERMTTAK